jgi:aryl-alcohol dehydrogenase-like predicted oxidoreductase
VLADTANIYTNGTSERYVGELVAPMRSQMVVATKYSSNVAAGGPTVHQLSTILPPHPPTR